MFMQPDTVPGKLDEGFSRPVESIMRCEDFKSNFARKLSNRFISRHVPTPRQDNSLKLCLDEKAQDAQESFEANQLSKFVAEPNCETVKPPDRQTTSSDIRSTKVNALNMEVETLRWQLAQTEANRQMHIALLRQVVTFLSRVKEHIEGQKTEGETEATRMNRSFNVTDLPRSRSVLHVNKNLEYTLSPVKKINSRKISKSISNVNGYKDCNVWSQSKMALTSETETAFKLSEEMSRLIILANTVLSTKLPDLACNCNDNEVNGSKQTEDNEEICEKESNVSVSNTSVGGEDTNAFVLNTICDSEGTYEGITNKFIETKDKGIADFIVSPSPLTCGLEKDFAVVKIQEKDSKRETRTTKPQNRFEKRNEYNAVNFIEDESGFSSMSSFQEIGIPIISIIPPSPCKEVGYMTEFEDLLQGNENWKSDSIELDKQAVKVFWV
ncbi:uncharacterized protein LOC114252831 [Bombyx mandarina]|uniref:Uncharacterized protein n=2 Tax=Bombyx TaxID=7090 RepID=A0A8R1WLK2_BOMMO|nr:uncharacterized protein LOC101738019 [Bombyx mori]XP_028043292.1 uncharacterized protein LOC114252831 [Bombyx mandarina]